MELDSIVLNRKEKKLLKKIIFLSNRADHGLASTDLIKQQSEYDKYYFYQLRDFGLIGTHHLPEPNEKTYWRPENGTYVTDKGRHYKDWHWEHLRIFIYKSVMAPIVITLLTNLVLYLLEKHLK